MSEQNKPCKDALLGHYRNGFPVWDLSREILNKTSSRFSSSQPKERMAGIKAGLRLVKSQVKHFIGHPTPTRTPSELISQPHIEVCAVIELVKLLKERDTHLFWAG